MRKSLIIFILIFCNQFAFTQIRTVGTIFTTDEALDGYTFFSPFSSTKAFMVDNCGRLINEWDRGTLPGLAAYFLENGLMMRTYKVDPVGPFTSASNAGGLELVDWDNNTVWSYELNTSEALSHHDAVMMPNGNILMLVWELIYEEELIALGRNPNEIAPQGFAWNEKIIEIKPIGTNEIEIVWSWKIKDHYIQNFDANQSNYGVVSEHPERFDINLPELNSPNSHSDLDYNHFNAIDYNEALDQILISVRNSDEIWIIDHSTTTEEAATNTGGRYDKGGDILYRWGNAASYQRASIADEVLFGQHGVHWVKNGVHKGKILIYNNGNGRPGQDYSTIELLVPEQNTDGSYPVPSSDPFGPSTSEWRYGEANSETFFSPYLSNAQMLSNGNILVNAGSPGNVFEIDQDKEMVWQYKIPLFGNVPATQGNNVNNNGVFRAYKFPKNFNGFNGLNIIPGATIENDPMPLNCDEEPNNTETSDLGTQISVRNNNKSIIVDNFSNEDNLKLKLYDLNGRLIMEAELQRGSNEVSLVDNRILFLQIKHDNHTVLVKKIFSAQ